jgi:hypothetical protein
VVLRPIPRSDVIQKSGFNTGTNLYQGQLSTSVYQEPGRWELMRFVARDNADNFLDLLATDHPEFASVSINFGGGLRIREKLLALKRGASSSNPPAPATPAALSARRRLPVLLSRGTCSRCSLASRRLTLRATGSEGSIWFRHTRPAAVA